MRLFLDTEWADKEARQPVSLALIDSAGRRFFYGEICLFAVGPTEFVREVVYPLLECDMGR